MCFICYVTFEQFSDGKISVVCIKKQYSNKTNATTIDFCQIWGFTLCRLLSLKSKNWLAISQNGCKPGNPHCRPPEAAKKKLISDDGIGEDAMCAGYTFS